MCVCVCVCGGGGGGGSPVKCLDLSVAFIRSFLSPGIRSTHGF